MNTSFPKITIVTPNYNCAAFLETTIKSILDQNYPNLEYIIIDGGSTDGSVDIIRKYESNLAYWVSEKDNGLYDAVNKGFKKSSGAIMGWINSDDCHWPGSLHYIAEVFSNNEQINWLQGLPVVINEIGDILYTMPHAFSKYHFLTEFDTVNFHPIQQESTFWKRSLWEKAGNTLSTKYTLAADFDLWIRFFMHSELYCTDRELGAFRVRAGQKSENRTKYMEEAEHSIASNQSKFGTIVRLNVFGYKIFNILTHFSYMINHKLYCYKHNYRERLKGFKKMI